MKKLIVVAMILMATICWADTKQDIFTGLEIADISTIAKAEPGTIIGITTMEPYYFKNAVNAFFKDKYLVLKSWTIVDTSHCIAFTDTKTIYAMCVDNKIVVLKSIN